VKSLQANACSANKQLRRPDANTPQTAVGYRISTRAWPHLEIEIACKHPAKRGWLQVQTPRKTGRLPGATGSCFFGYACKHPAKRGRLQGSHLSVPQNGAGYRLYLGLLLEIDLQTPRKTGPVTGDLVLSACKTPICVCFPLRRSDVIAPKSRQTEADFSTGFRSP
jgi:hypothetical protein